MKKILLLFAFTLNLSVSAQEGSKFNKAQTKFDFYLLRVFNKLKCGSSLDTTFWIEKWCLFNKPELINNKIELHFKAMNRSLLKKLKHLKNYSKLNLLYDEFLGLTHELRFGYGNNLISIDVFKDKSNNNQEEKMIANLTVIYMHYFEKDIEYILKYDLDRKLYIDIKR